MPYKCPKFRHFILKISGQKLQHLQKEVEDKSHHIGQLNFLVDLCKEKIDKKPETVVDGSSVDDFDGVTDQTVSVTTSDSDIAGFTVIESGGTTTVAEDGSTTDDFTVVLDAQPTSDVVLSIVSADTGEVTVAAPDEESRNKALEFIKRLIAKPEMGKIYKGKVVKIMEFGAFVNFLGKQDGLVHISELATKRVAKVGDVVKEGDEVSVKVVGFDRGKVKLSIKQAVA